MSIDCMWNDDVLKGVCVWVIPTSSTTVFINTLGWLEAKTGSGGNGYD